MKENHNKIINQAARTVLKGQGLFQKGQSRTWIDDHGWFFIIVEFQPSNWCRGSYLNVGIHYLWHNQDYLSFDYGYRQSGFVPFEGSNEEFYAKMVSLAEKAMEKVTEYRNFHELAFAKEEILNRSGFSSCSKELYNKMMICGLTGDHRAANYYRQLLEEIQHSELGYEIDYYKELSGDIALVIDDKKQLRDYIHQKILVQRTFWHSKSSMKKLPVYYTEDSLG